MSGLSTHALDLAHGRPAAGMTIELWAFEPSGARLLKRIVTNRDGRTDAPLLAADEMRPGRYGIVFHLGAYYRGLGTPAALFDEVPIHIVIERPEEHHHVPLLASPFGYSTYRGS